MLSKSNPSFEKIIFRHHVPNKLLSSEKRAHQVMLLFFSDGKQLLSGWPPLYQNKLQEQGVQDAVNRNKIKFVPIGDFVDQAFSQFNENSINNQDPHSQIEIMKHQGQIIQKTQKQTKPLQFLTLCQKYYHMIKLQKG